MSSVRQRFARQRNWNKGRLIGVNTHLRACKKFCTEKDQQKLEQAQQLIKEVIGSWDASYSESLRRFLSDKRV